MGVLVTYNFFQRKNCFLVLDLKSGGDLRYYIKCKTIFNETDVAIMTACLISAIEHIHSRNVIHRDIKPGISFALFFNAYLF